jgi:purine catabolism regulator
MAEVITVRDALRLEVFQRTRVHVFAGADRLDRPVRWVHTAEIPDIHRFLSGQEMLLTAGFGMGDTEAEQRAFIRRLADAKAAVLVVTLTGRKFDAMPEAVVDEAGAVGLPLVGLDDEIPFVEVSAQVHEVLVETRISRLIAEEATGQAFVDLLLADEDYAGMVRELARRTGHAVVLEDVAHRMLAHSGSTPAAAELVAGWDAHSRAVHERHHPVVTAETLRSVTQAGSFGHVVACARAAVVLRGESWGWLHLLHGGVPPTSADLRAVERAAAAIAISLLSERASGALAAQRHGTLLNRLLLEDVTGEKFVSRGLALGQDLRDRDLIVVVTAREAAGRPFGGQDLSRLLREGRWPAVVGDIGDFDLAVVGLNPAEGVAPLLTALTQRGVRGGVSRVVTPTALPQAIRQGRSAASVAASTPECELVRFDDLGALRLLVALSEGPELTRYVEDELGALLEHDARTGNPLLPTLRAFLQCGGNKARAADVLFVQRRTLYHRLDRLRDILGLDPVDVDHQQRLQLAVRGYDLLRRRSRRHR